MLFAGAILEVMVAIHTEDCDVGNLAL